MFSSRKSGMMIISPKNHQIMKLCINSRDELMIINLDEVACFNADGNYTNIHYIGGQKFTVSIGLSKMEKLVSSAFPPGQASSFVRLGRSFLINQKYLCHIDTLKQKIVLSDFRKSTITLNVTKNLLKTYKAFVSKSSQKPTAKPSTKLQ